MEQLKKIWSMFSTAITLAAFVAIGFWGHRTHWKMIPSSEHTSESHVSDSQSTLGHSKDTKAGLTSESHESQSPGNSVERVGIVRAKDRLMLEEDESAEAAGLRVVSAVNERWREVVPALGTVAYNGQRIAQLSTRADGHVKAVFTKLGQKVSKGDVLALIDSQDVGEAKSDWLQKAATARFRQRTLAQMLATGDEVLPMKRIREAEAELREADLASFMAQQRLMNLGFVMDFELQVDATPEQLAEQVRYLGIPQSILEQLSTKPTTANLFAIIAPFDGVVVEQNAVAGEMVSSTHHQFVIADTSVMWIKLSVRREHASKLNVGQEVEFAADGLAQPVKTRLAWISAEIDPQTRTIQAGCEVTNVIEMNDVDADDEINPSNRLLRANQFGLAKILVTDDSNAVLVPESAVQKMPNQQSIIFVADANHKSFEPRVVRVGLRQDGRAQVLEGVASGEFIVSEGSYILKSELMRSELVGG